MMESWYGPLGAGCIITSVFLALMVRPTLSQAVENPSISSCISCSLLVLGVHCLSSAKRKSLSTVQVSFTFVTTCRRLRLNSFPSDLCLILMPASQSLDASVSIAENIKLNSVGTRTQPCVTPLETGKDSDGSPSSRTRAYVPSLNWRTMVMNLWGSQTCS